MPYIYDIRQHSVLKLYNWNNLEETLGRNIVRKIREELLMSKAELARKAGVSSLTIDRIERGKSCRMETKRKIILALGYDLTDKGKVFLES
jgi:DNA-binding XRE family transcriptional regulator